VNENTILGGSNNEGIFDKIPVDMMEKENYHWHQITYRKM
jgi:hypothetical protein